MFTIFWLYLSTFLLLSQGIDVELPARRGPQTTFEYLLLVGGVVVLALVVVYMLTHSAQSAGSEISTTTQQAVEEFNNKVMNVVQKIPAP